MVFVNFLIFSVANFGQATKTYHKHKDRKEFSLFCLKNAPPNEDLFFMLQRPLKRIGFYISQLQEIMKETDSALIDYAELDLAIIKLQEIEVLCGSHKDDVATLEKIASIKSQILHLKVEFSPLNNIRLRILIGILWILSERVTCTCKWEIALSFSKKSRPNSIVGSLNRF